MIIPYKYCGLDLSQTKPFINDNLIVANKYSYRIYQLPQLKILIDGLTFDKKIKAIYSQNNYIYVASSKKLYTIKEQVINIDEYDEKINSILIFYPIKVVATQHKLYINDNQLNFQGIMGIFHMPTYLNKIILYTHKAINIINIVQLKTVATLDLSEINKTDSQIVLVKNTPALDIVVVALKNPACVLLVNIATFEIIATYQVQDIRINDIAINKQGRVPMMAIAQENKVTFWNLNSQEQIYKYDYEGTVDWLFFIEDSSIYIGSSEVNAIQQFSLDEHKMMSNLRERRGFKDYIQQCAFYGQIDEELINSIAISKDELRFQSLVNENLVYSKSGSFNNFSFSILRDRDWSNILTSTSKQYLQLSNTFQKTEVRVAQLPQDQIYQTFVTNCGNYGFVAYESKIIRFTMQSGYKQKEYQLTSKFQKMYVDQQNSYLIVAEQGILSQIDFVSGQVMQTKETSKQTILFAGSKLSNLLAIVYGDNSIEIIDIVSLKVIRSFSGHSSKIFDIKFSLDNQHIVSTGLDKTLKIWNLVYGQLVQEIQLQIPLISIDISQKQIIGVFLNSRQICIWKSMLHKPECLAKAQRNSSSIFKSDLSVKSQDPRAQLYISNKQKVEQEYHSEDLTLPPYPEDYDEYIKFTELDEGRWLPIQHIDQIRERNKVILAEADVKIPFFLDFRNADQERKSMLEEVKGQLQEKSKILKAQKDRFLAELKSDFESLLESGDKLKFLDLLKTLSPTSYDYELRSSILGKPQNIMKLLNIFEELLKSKSDFDLKITYLLRFIQVAKEDFTMIDDVNFKQKLIVVSQMIEQQWEDLKDIQQYAQCVIEYTKTKI